MKHLRLLSFLLGVENASSPAGLLSAFSRLDHEVQDFLLLSLAEYWSRAGKNSELIEMFEELSNLLNRPLPKADSEKLEFQLRRLEPRATTEYRRWTNWSAVPASTIEPKEFSALDYEILDRIFDEILPRQFAEQKNSEDFADFRRPAQKEMARRIVQTLGSEHFLLIDAPTGTGKTLAYLIPALLCAARWEVRIGIATYTRALQEQAYHRELPRALKALEEAGLTTSFRASLLKGKQNYLCWKRLKHAFPNLEEPAEEFLAWFLLTRFALTDPTGDLDRFSFELPETLEKKSRLEEIAMRLRREVAATRNCCRPGEEKRLCCADIALRRAEKSHVVLTNHAFTLAAPEFFHHLIFDEAEHLHHQALSSESLEFRPYILARVLTDLSQGKKSSRAPLDQLRAQGNLLAAEWGPRAPQAISAWTTAKESLEQLDYALADFESWRQQELRRRDPKEAHALFTEYANDPMGESLYAAREQLYLSVTDLVQALENLSEDLATAPMHGASLLRTQLSRSQEDLENILESFSLILPTGSGRFQFDRDYFYDLEIDSRRKHEMLLARRILLPDSWLAKRFWPGIQSAAMLSATAHLHGGFDSSSSYLGLDRITGREGGMALETFRAPDPFDYSRVLFAVPTDAPRFDMGREGKEAFLQYVSRFVFELCTQVRGKCLVLFTNNWDLQQVATKLKPLFQSENLPLWYQGMEGLPKEKLADRFRENPNSTLLGLDTFWYGVDFPGGICEYVVLVKLPYGQLDRYHFAQKAALGDIEQRKRIYLPKALAMFRQGFGRLMRTKEDSGVVFLLDRRSLESRHRDFFKELPGQAQDEYSEPVLKTLFAPTKRCLEAALAHRKNYEAVNLAEDIQGTRTELLQGTRIEPEDQSARSE